MFVTCCILKQCLYFLRHTVSVTDSEYSFSLSKLIIKCKDSGEFLQQLDALFDDLAKQFIRSISSTNQYASSHPHISQDLPPYITINMLYAISGLIPLFWCAAQRRHFLAQVLCFFCACSKRIPASIFCRSDATVHRHSQPIYSNLIRRLIRALLPRRRILKFCKSSNRDDSLNDRARSAFMK